MNPWTKATPLPPLITGESEGPRFDRMYFNNYWLYYKGCYLYQNLLGCVYFPVLPPLLAGVSLSKCAFIFGCYYIMDVPLF